LAGRRGKKKDQKKTEKEKTVQSSSSLQAIKKEKNGRYVFSLKTNKQTKKILNQFTKLEF
jgi:hypothetical protein